MKRGRKSSWDTKINHRLLEIAAWARDGHTEKEICKVLRISIPTFIKFKKEKISLFEALKVNKEIADITVENSLFKRANGYEFEEVTQEVQTDAEGNITRKHVKKVKKEVAPDTKAIERWLMNRKPETWRAINNVIVSGPGGGAIPFDVKKIMTTQAIEDELKKRGIPVPDTGGENIEAPGGAEK